MEDELILPREVYNKLHIYSFLSEYIDPDFITVKNRPYLKEVIYDYDNLINNLPIEDPVKLEQVMIAIKFRGVSPVFIVEELLWYHGDKYTEEKIESLHEIVKDSIIEFKREKPNVYELLIVKAECRNIYTAASIGYLRLVKHLIGTIDAVYQQQHLFNSAIKGKNIDIVKYLVSKGYLDKYSSVQFAAEYSNCKIAKYLLSKGAILNRYAVSSAVKSDNIDVLKLIYKINPSICVSVFDFAIKYNKLKILKWCYKKPYMVIPEGETERRLSAITQSINNNNILIFNWLIKIGFQPNDNTLEIAAVNGNLNIVKYLRTLGCQYNSYIYSSTIRAGFHNVANWILEDGCPSVIS